MRRRPARSSSRGRRRRAGRRRERRDLRAEAREALAGSSSATSTYRHLTSGARPLPGPRALRRVERRPCRRLGRDRALLRGRQGRQSSGRFRRLGGFAHAAPVHRGPGGGQRRRILVLCALLLAFAAETAGLGPDRPLRHDSSSRGSTPSTAARSGRALLGATTLFQRLGAHITAVVMFTSGALLLSGATMAGLSAGAGRAAQRAHTGPARCGHHHGAARSRAAPPGSPGEDRDQPRRGAGAILTRT